MSFTDSIEKRRSIYALGKDLPHSEDQITEWVMHSVKHVPSAFNSQSSRVMVLFGAAHDRMWSITMEALRKIMPEDKFAPTEQKINAFAAAAGTILYYEDQAVVDHLKANFAAYAHNFQNWSEQASGMLQHTIWTRLAEQNVGASLQHYNELIEGDLSAAFEVPSTWRLIAQMPFGSIEAPPKEKSFGDLAARVKTLHQ